MRLEEKGNYFPCIVRFNYAIFKFRLSYFFYFSLLIASGLYRCIIPGIGAAFRKKVVYCTGTCNWWKTV